MFDVIGSLYSAALEPERWPQAVQDLAESAGGYGAVIVPLSSWGQSMPLEVIATESLAEVNEEYKKEWNQYDMRIAKAVRARITSGVFTDYDFVSDDDIRRDPFYQDFLHRWGVGFMGCIICSPSPGHVFALSAQRKLTDGRFERKDLRAIEQIAPHAARAVAISARLAAAEQAHAGLRQVLETLGCAAFVLSSRREVLFMNHAAEELLGDGIVIRNRQLQARLAQESRALDMLTVWATDSKPDETPPAPVALSRGQGRKSLMVQAIPIGRANADRLDGVLLPSATTALVLVTDLECPTAGRPVEQLRVLGLTPSEARLAVIVGSGKSPKEAADELAITESTARVVLKRVFEKLDLRRQSELALLVARLSRFGTA